MQGQSLSPEFVELVQNALAEVTVVEVGPITADRKLRDIGLDSMALAELILLMEERLDVSLERSHLNGIDTFGDLEALLGRLRAARPS